MEINYMKPSFEVWETPDPDDGQGILEYLERVARICYKSEDKICEGSAERLLKNIMERGHHAIIEHYTFTFAVSSKIYKSVCVNPLLGEDNEEYVDALRYIHPTYKKSKDKDVPQYIISGNIRAFNKLFALRPDVRRDCYGIERIMSLINHRVPLLAPVPDYVEPVDESVEIRVMKRNEIWKLPPEVRKMHNWFPVKFTMDRSISHQLVRHRDAAFAMESTRWINYAKKGYNAILPHWMPDGIADALIDDNGDPQMWSQFPADMVVATKAWCMGVEKILEAYNYMMHMRDHKFIPDDLKGLIPDSIKTEILMTTNENEWDWVLGLRTKEDVHPEMRELACGLKTWLENNVQPLYKYQPDDPEEQQKRVEALKKIIETAQEELYDATQSTTVRFLDEKSARDRSDSEG